MTRDKFKEVVMRGIHYEAENDDFGARVLTNLQNTPCPRCSVIVQPDVEHLCGNRLPNPFAHADGTQAVDAESRIRIVRDFSIEQCNQALHVAGLQKTVALAIVRRVRKIKAGGAK